MVGRAKCLDPLEVFFCGNDVCSAHIGLYSSLKLC